MFDIVTAKTLLFLLGIFESKSFLQFVSIISNLSSNFRLNQSKAWLTRQDLYPPISNQDIRCRIEGLINP